MEVWLIHHTHDATYLYMYVLKIHTAITNLKRLPLIHAHYIHCKMPSSLAKASNVAPTGKVQANKVHKTLKF